MDRSQRERSRHLADRVVRVARGNGRVRGQSRHRCHPSQAAGARGYRARAAACRDGNLAARARGEHARPAGTRGPRIRGRRSVRRDRAVPQYARRDCVARPNRRAGERLRDDTYRRDSPVAGRHRDPPVREQSHARLLVPHRPRSPRTRRIRRERARARFRRQRSGPRVERGRTVAARDRGGACERRVRAAVDRHPVRVSVRCRQRAAPTGGCAGAGCRRDRRHTDASRRALGVGARDGPEHLGRARARFACPRRDALADTRWSRHPFPRRRDTCGGRRRRARARLAACADRARCVRRRAHGSRARVQRNGGGAVGAVGVERALGQRRRDRRSTAHTREPGGLRHRARRRGRHRPADLRRRSRPA